MTVFRLPFENGQSVKRPTEVSGIKAAQNTLDCAHPGGMASHDDSGVWISQKNTRLIRVGVRSRSSIVSCPWFALFRLPSPLSASAANWSAMMRAFAEDESCP
ncbi:MAG: hypothetical protein RLZZ227_1757 [Pseudomonadota bacterium]